MNFCVSLSWLKLHEFIICPQTAGKHCPPYAINLKVFYWKVAIQLGKNSHQTSNENSKKLEFAVQTHRVTWRLIWKEIFPRCTKFSKLIKFMEAMCDHLTATVYDGILKCGIRSSLRLNLVTHQPTLISGFCIAWIPILVVFLFPHG